MQYDLLSGKLICCDTYSGTESDGKYVDVMDNYTKAGDLRLSDLGYYKVDYLKKTDEKKAFFISKLKSTSIVYKKNPSPKLRKNGTIVKSTEYIKFNILATNKVVFIKVKQI